MLAQDVPLHLQSTTTTTKTTPYVFFYEGIIHVELKGNLEADEFLINSCTCLVTVRIITAMTFMVNFAVVFHSCFRSLLNFETLSSPIVQVYPPRTTWSRAQIGTRRRHPGHVSQKLLFHDHTRSSSWHRPVCVLCLYVCVCVCVCVCMCVWLHV